MASHDLRQFYLNHSVQTERVNLYQFQSRLIKQILPVPLRTLFPGHIRHHPQIERSLEEADTALWDDEVVDQDPGVTLGHSTGGIL